MTFTDLVFVGSLGLCCASLLRWAFKALPEEGWQIMATVPRTKESSGRWVGVNLTYYGLITASATLLAIVTFLVLSVSIGVSLEATALVIAGVLAVSLPAAKLSARIVEGKQHTFSVAGATFVGLLMAPLVIVALDASHAFGSTGVPLAPTMAAMTLAYVFGEGVGRLACISFGCCYGKPLARIGRRTRRLLGRFHVSFRGQTKKISYASGLEGVQVVPIQALTSTLHMLVGVIALLLFLASWYRAAFLAALGLSQAWRAYSETLRADHRGGTTVSPYQIMALLGLVYAVAGAALLPVGPSTSGDLVRGIATLWHPAVIVTLEATWVGVFLLTGWSMVTGSHLSFHVHHDRV